MKAPRSLRGSNQHSNSHPPRKNILQRNIKSPSGFLPSYLGSGCRHTHSQAGYSAFCFNSQRLLGPEGPQLRPAYSPVVLAVFLQSFLCHRLHKFRVVPGDFCWDRHSDRVRIKELQNHLREASGNAGVRAVGSHLEGGKASEGLTR